MMKPAENEAKINPVIKMGSRCQGGMIFFFPAFDPETV